jgi:hypothetical protein
VSNQNGTITIFRYDDAAPHYAVRQFVSTWIAILPLSLTTGEVCPSLTGYARISSFDLETKACSTVPDSECFFAQCQVPEMCGGQVTATSLFLPPSFSRPPPLPRQEDSLIVFSNSVPLVLGLEASYPRRPQRVCVFMSRYA